MKSVKPNKIKDANLITQTETKRADTIATTCSFSTNNRRRKKKQEGINNSRFNNSELLFQRS